MTGFGATLEEKRLFGVIGAMEEEITLLREMLHNAREEGVGGFTLFSGTLAGHAALLAQSGIGKVNAAALAQLLILRGVSHVLFTGVAGGLEPGLKVGDLVVSTDAVQHDVDVTALGYAPGEVPGEGASWPADEQLRALALSAAADLEGVRAVAGRVASGDQFVADRDKGRRLREIFGAACAEMEGAAVAQVCHKAGVPFVIIRSLSDSADEGAQTDFRTFTLLAAERAKRVVLGVLTRFPAP
jgi:adenosylhomocysteine nucleosidase